MAPSSFPPPPPSFPTPAHKAQYFSSRGAATSIDILTKQNPKDPAMKEKVKYDLPIIAEMQRQVTINSLVAGGVAYLINSKVFKVNRFITALGVIGTVGFVSSLTYMTEIQRRIPPLIKVAADQGSESFVADVVCAGMKELEPCVKDPECATKINDVIKSLYSDCLRREANMKGGASAVAGAGEVGLSGSDGGSDSVWEVANGESSFGGDNGKDFGSFSSTPNFDDGQGNGSDFSSGFEEFSSFDKDDSGNGSKRR